MSGDSKKLIAFRYFGGKFSLSDKIPQYFPNHIHFIEVFCGSAVISLNKEPSAIDTINDINGEVINFFRILRNDPDELIRQLRLTPASREEFNNSWHIDDDNDMERARKFYIRMRQSFFGLGAAGKNKGWHISKTKSTLNMSETVSIWQNGIEKLNNIIERLQRIQIENRSYKEIIPALDFDGAFFYCDPPYPRDSRSTYNDYKFEFSNTDHEQLADLLHNIKGKAMISGYYESETMHKLYKDWKYVKFPVKFNNLRQSQVQECIWMNYDPDTEKKQLKIQFKINGNEK